MMIDLKLSTAARAHRAVVFAIVIALCSVIFPFQRAAASPAGDAAADAVAWIATQVTPGGYIPGPGGIPAAGPTVTAALALATARVGGDTFDAIVSWLEVNVDVYVVDENADDRPGALAQLVIIADAAGIDPTNFGGHDLVDRLEATLSQGKPGLYGVQDPTYDGVYRQSLAIIALVAAGRTPDATATAWLGDQQCTAPAAAAGGWEAYRADPSAACNAPDPMFFTGPDSNSTAMAIEALVALGGTTSPRLSAALSFLAAAQTPDGGFGYVAGGDSDPNSTALVLQALAAAGENPTAAPWIAPGGDPVSSLLAWRIGCDAPEEDRGAFASPYSGGYPDAFATMQAVWGASGTAFPTGVVNFGPLPQVCSDNLGSGLDTQPDTDPSTSTTVTPSTTPQTSPTTEGVAAGVLAGTVAPTQHARAVSAQPTLAG